MADHPTLLRVVLARDRGLFGNLAVADYAQIRENSMDRVMSVVLVASKSSDNCRNRVPALFEHPLCWMVHCFPDRNPAYQLACLPHLGLRQCRVVAVTTVDCWLKCPATIDAVDPAILIYDCLPYYCVASYCDHPSIDRGDSLEIHARRFRDCSVRFYGRTNYRVDVDDPSIASIYRVPMIRSKNPVWAE